MTFLSDNFHFLRPEWLWALVPATVLAVLLWNGRFRSVGNTWARYVDAHLLSHLSVRGGKKQRRSRLMAPVAFAAVVLVITGLAGPTWQKTDVPSFTGGEPVVAVLSLAQSMNADDLTPSRLKRSVHKLRDILSRTQGDERGLVIYSDVPFVAAPLTNDARVIEQMLSELSTSLMPVLGNRLDLAIGEAQQVLERADATRGQIIVIADNSGSEPDASLAAAEAARRAGYTVSVLAAGTEEGATLQTADGRAISNSQGQTFMTKLSKESLEALASSGGGQFSMITAGDADLNVLLPVQDQNMRTAGEANDFQADSWVDMGYWLLIVPALLAPFVFRRGVLMGFVVIGAGLMAQPQQASASTWDDLWATRDQQAQTAFLNGEFESAARTFDVPEWQAGAAYRAGEYGAAVAAYSRSQDPQRDYNLGNALAKSGDLEGALEAYDRALEAAPADEDAQFNRDLVAKLLEEQQQQEQEQQQQSQDQQQQDQQGGEGQEDQQDQNRQGQQNQQDQQQNAGDQQDQQQESGSENQEANSQGAEDQNQQEQSGEQQSADQQSGEQETSEQQADSQQDGQESNAQQSGEVTPEEQQQENADAQEQAGEDQQVQDRMAEQKAMEQEEIGDQAEAPQEQQADGQTTEMAEEADQQQPMQPQSSEGAEPQEQAEQEPSENMLSRLFSEALSGNGEEEDEPVAEAYSRTPPPVDQAVEQQLRRVPDDPSGLLKARIHQHYARLRAAQ
ncbi:MAG: VWA domain-containing protein [Pseudomonadota bacterium]